VVWLISLTQQQQRQQRQQQEQEIWTLLFVHISVSAIIIKAIFGTFVKYITPNGSQKFEPKMSGGRGEIAV